MADDPLVVVATALIVLLATTLLAAGPLYTNAVTEAGLRRRLATAPPAEVGVEVVLRSSASTVPDLDPAVRDAVAARLPDVVAGVDRITESDSVRSDALGETTITTVAVLADDELLEEVEPASTTEVEGVAVAIHEETAAQTGLGLGQVVELETRSGGRARVTVGSLVRPVDAGDRRWWDSPLVRDGVSDGSTFTRVGPLLVPDDAALRAVVGDERVTSRWRVRLAPGAITTAELRRVQQGVTRLADDVTGLDGVGSAVVETDLDRLLATTSRELTATRASVVVTALQLAVLALYTLGLVANLVVDTRTVETTLVRARGADPTQIGTAAALEGLVLAVPAVALGPPLAAALLRRLDDIGVLADVGLSLVAQLTPSSFLASAAAGLAAVLVLVVPARRAARTTFASARASRSRAADRSWLQRSGADLALLLVAVAGLLQLRRAGSSVADDVAGVSDVDPLLVVAPALGLLAGAVLVLRLVPLLGSMAVRLSARRPGFVGTLAAWQIGRRPAATSRSLLLLVLAVAIGTFASAYSVTWSGSQRDQAVAEVGADLRVRPDTRPATGQPPLVLGAGYEGLDGVERAVAGLGDRVRLGSGGTAALVAVDLADPSSLRRRDDVVRSAGALHEPAAVAGIPVPGPDPRTMTFDLTVRVADPTSRFAVIVTVQDADGLVHTVLADGLAADGEVQQVEVPLARTVADRVLSVRGPLRLLAVELLTAPVPIPGPAAVPTLDETAIEVLLTDLAVDDRQVDLGAASDWVATVSRTVAGPVPPGIADAEVDATGLRLVGDVGAAAAAGRTAYQFAPPEPGTLADVPAAVTPGILEATGLVPGDRLAVDVGGADVTLRIDQVVDLVPTVPDDDRAVLVDLATLAAQRWVRAQSVTVPDRWLLAVEDDRHASVAAAAVEPPFRSPGLLDVDAETTVRRSDPVAVGLIGALTAGLAAAGVLAALGYLVTATVGVRQRTSEFALLRALGVSRRETRRWLAIESVVTVGGGIVTGLLLGVALALVILPAVSLARDGGAAVPAPRLVIPWDGIGVVVAGAAAVLLAVPLLLSTLVERTRVAEVLRLGDE